MSQNFGIILVTYLFYSLCYNENILLAFKREAVLHHLIPPICLFINPMLISRWRTPFLKLPPPLVYWSVTSTRSEPWIITNNYLRKLGLDYTLGVTSVWFPQILGIYSWLFEQCEILQYVFTDPSGWARSDTRSIFFIRVWQVWIQSFLSPRLIA